MKDPCTNAYLDHRGVLSSRIASLEKALRSEAKRSQSTARLMSMPGMGPITAMAVEAFSPTMVTFRRGRDFAAWLGLMPKQHSTGGKQALCVEEMRALEKALTDGRTCDALVETRAPCRRQKRAASILSR